MRSACLYVGFLFVCLSVCLFIYILKPHVHISQSFLFMLLVAMAQSSSDGSTNTLCTSGFVDDVIFICWTKQASIRDDVCVSYSSSGGGTGGKDCRLRLHLVHCGRFRRGNGPGDRRPICLEKFENMCKNYRQRWLSNTHNCSTSVGGCSAIALPFAGKGFNPVTLC